METVRRKEETTIKKQKGTEETGCWEITYTLAKDVFCNKQTSNEDLVAQ